MSVAREAIEALRELAPTRLAMGTTRTLRDRSVAHSRLGRAEGLVRSARAYYYASLEESWERVQDGPPDIGQRTGDLLAGVHAVASCVEAVDVVYGLSGSSAIYERSPIERHFRDIQTLRHHGFVCENRLEAVGQVLLGVEPEFLFIAF